MMADNKFKIIWPVIVPIAILMVNLFPFMQWAPNHLCHYKTVLLDIFFTVCVIFLDVARGILENKLLAGPRLIPTKPCPGFVPIFIGTFPTAKLSGIFCLLEPTMRNGKFLPAVFADSADHLLVWASVLFYIGNITCL